jgi:hypothetical protein
MTDQDSNKNIQTSVIIKTLIEHEKENNVFIRHYEDVRFKISQINMTLSVFLLGASRFENLHQSKLLFSLLIIILGIHGILVCAKYTERADRHAIISRAYRRALSDQLGSFSGTTMEGIHQQAVERHEREKNFTGLFVNVQARWFWVAIHSAAILVGVFVAFS